jgi:hypothetical protein
MVESNLYEKIPFAFLDMNKNIVFKNILFGTLSG